MTESELFAPTRWHLDPTRIGVGASAWRDRTPPEPFCLEVGRRLLLAELEFSEWILRRVEKITMEEDRSVSRRIALEFTIRDDAPEFVLPSGESCWLVPLTIMQRRTLVGLELLDGDNRSVLMPGIRLTQQLDQSILLAAVACVRADLVAHDEVRRFVQLAIYGERRMVAWAYHRFDHADNGPLRELRESELFRFVAERFRHNFSLFVFSGQGHSSAGAHLVRLSFSEPTDWRHQKPALDPAGDGVAVNYQPGVPDRFNAQQVMSALGIRPIRVRFQIPGAESAASFHCEITAPPGLQIVRAAMLAGRPNGPRRHVSADEVIGHAPVAGLHAVEIPNGSLCRAQVDLGIPARGWLATVCLSTLAIVGVLASVALHIHSRRTLTTEQFTNVILILVTTSGAGAALVAQRDHDGVAARFLTYLRFLGTVELILPLLVAGLLSYSALAHDPPRPLGWLPPVLWLITGIGAVIGIVFLIVAVRSLWIQRHTIPWESPWDQTRHDRDVDAVGTNDPPGESEVDFCAALDEYGFRSAAVGVRSAEGWHERYTWSDKAQRIAVKNLRRVGTEHASTLPERCRSTCAAGASLHSTPCTGCMDVGPPLRDREDAADG